MHGYSPGFALLRNVEVGSMGGFLDCGVGLDTKPSPRRVAIEKAQAELRKEYDVREERKRELEFLENGGNPLDFKFGRAASAIPQSTSFTDQQAEQHVTSEAKYDFAPAASPHGDSVGSSGRLGGSVGKEPNIADNLLLLDGENSNPGGEKNVKRSGKRGSVSLLEQPLAPDGCTNAKETEESLIFHLGVKRQAYTRRNRSRTGRDNHSNKSTLPSSVHDHRDGNRSTRDELADNPGISSVTNSKPAVSNGNVISKGSTSDNQLLDGVQAHDASVRMVKDEVQKGEAEAYISEAMQETDHSNQQTSVAGELVANFVPSRSSGLIGKDEATSVNSCLVSLEPTVNIKDTSSAERVGSSFPDKDMTDVVDDDLTRKNFIVGSVAEVLSLKNAKTDICHADKENSIEDANNDNHGMIRSGEGTSTLDCKDSSVFRSTSENSAVKEKSLVISVEAPTTASNQSQPAPLNSSHSIMHIKDEIDLCDKRADMSSALRPLDMGNLKASGEVVPKQERKTVNSLLDSSHSINKAGVITSSLVVPNCDPSTTAFSKRGTTTTSAIQNSAGNKSKLAKKAREDAILKEARIIEVNIKRAAQLSTSYDRPEKRKKCHWDFVLEEMEWMATDFMQERLWKTAAAAGICHRIASTGRSKFEHRIICQKQRNIARTLAKAVMHFWHSIDAFQTTELTLKDQNGECNPDLLNSCKANGTTAEKGQIGLRLGIQAYAVRFLKYDCNISYQPVLANSPTNPDRIHDIGMLEKYCEDELSEENLFYRIPPGAMQVYREAMESHLMNYKKMGNAIHREDWEATPCDSVPGGSRESEYEEEEGETGLYLLPGRSEVTMSPKLTHKKRKNFHQKLHASRVYNVSGDFAYEPFLEGKSANQATMFTGKRPSSNLSAGPIPTKRVRTASRQRVVGSFSAAATGNLPVTNKTDASSGDTNSFQDYESSMHGGSQSWRNMEVESTADYEVQFPFDGSEISTKSQKNKSKHLGHSSYSDSGALVVSGKRDQVKTNLESQQFESNGKIGIFGQHAAKKPKLLKQLAEPPPEAIKPATGSTASPATSQMSYMSNQNKLIKIITTRDRGRKSKALKVSARQSSSGISWTTFEDQALVVLVHDMGPNWELVSDAINSTLQFKCIFRKPMECKERHKILMDKCAGDAADSVEDSGSSQPYPSTLPGIPKGSAIQLFQRLQRPMEEDTVKAHFEKIIFIGQQLPSCRTQKDTKQLKQLTSIHSSHEIALSQTYPNNLTGGVLSPLDLCDAISPSPDVLTLGYPGSHTSGAAPPNHPNQQGSLSPVPSNSSVNSMLQGSSGIVLGSNSLSPPTPLNAPARDAQRYCMPRATSLPVDDQQRMHYSQMLSSRNIQQSSLSVPGAFLAIGVDRGAYMLPSASGNGMGMMGGRTMPMSKPGFQGINSPGMPVVSTGSMLASGGVGLPNPANVNSLAVSSPGNSLLRPRDPLQVMRPGQITEDHRQMMMQDLPPQVSQGNAQVVPPFNATSVPFSTGTGLPSVQSYPAQQHPLAHQKPLQTHMHGNSHHSHIQGTNNSSPQQQAYAVRHAKERQLQQRMVPLSQQPYSASHAMQQVQNNSQLQQKPQPYSCAHLTPSHAQHKLQQMPHNPQASSGMPNQFIKQIQRQQAPQQPPRHQLQQKQPSQQLTKVVKGLGRGTTLMHQNPIVPSQASGTVPAPRNQASEKQGQGFFHGSSGLNPNLPQSSNHHKLYSHPPPQSAKQIQLLASHSDACNQTPIPVSTNQPLSSSQQPALPSSMPLAAPSQQQQRHNNQQTPRMLLQQNWQPNADGRIQSSGDQVQRVNQMIPATSLPRGTDSVNSAALVSSPMQRKPDPSHDSTKTAPISHVAGSSQENLVGTETVVPYCSEGAEQRQISGSVATDGHVVGARWQQQQPQSQDQQEPPQHPHREVVQGGVYTQPSNSGPS